MRNLCTDIEIYHDFQFEMIGSCIATYIAPMKNMSIYIHTCRPTINFQHAAIYT